VEHLPALNVQDEWVIELDSFSDITPLGTKNFTNIIVTPKGDSQIESDLSEVSPKQETHSKGQIIQYNRFGSSLRFQIFQGIFHRIYPSR
jgi:hypothetical protein